MGEMQNKWYADNAERIRKKANERVAFRRARNQQWLVNYMVDRVCEDCGENDARKLAFDHLDPSNKLANIADIVSKGKPLEQLEIEIKKCRILCHNCHMLHTINQNGGSYHDKMSPMSAEEFESKYGKQAYQDKFNVKPKPQVLEL